MIEGGHALGDLRTIAAASNPIIPILNQVVPQVLQNMAVPSGDSEL